MIQRELEGEELRRAFESLVEKYGKVELERRMSRREIYRKYYKKWPYDGTTTFLPLEAADDIAADDDPLEMLIDEEATANIFVDLTEKQRIVVRLSAEGYKPREIAEQEGQTSLNWRWHKNAAKKKLLAKYKGEK